MGTELQLQTTLEVRMYLIYSVKMGDEFAIYPEKCVRIKHLVYFIQGIIYWEALVVQIDKEGDFILGVEVSHFFCRNRLYTITQLA